MFMDRKLKIQYKYLPRANWRYRRVPQLRLLGIWLERSGFEIGDHVQVTVKEGELIIKLLPADGDA